MNTIFMNSKSIKLLILRILLNFSDKTYLKRSDRYLSLSNISIYYIWKNTKTSYKNNNFKISTPA